MLPELPASGEAGCLNFLSPEKHPLPPLQGKRETGFFYSDGRQNDSCDTRASFGSRLTDKFVLAPPSGPLPPKGSPPYFTAVGTHGDGDNCSDRWLGFRGARCHRRLRCELGRNPRYSMDPRSAPMEG
jgi:hypothetical protein